MIKKISFLFFLTLLTSCKTLEDRVDLGEGGLKSAAKSFTSSINPFEKKANEYKKLIADKKYEDADYFLKNNKEFFDKRYQLNLKLHFFFFVLTLKYFEIRNRSLNHKFLQKIEIVE
jgi:hypothetical protein